MAVCRKDRAYKHYTNNPIPTSFFVCDILLSLFSEMTQWETTLSMLISTCQGKGAGTEPSDLTNTSNLLTACM